MIGLDAPAELMAAADHVDAVDAAGFGCAPEPPQGGGRIAGGPAPVEQHLPPGDLSRPEAVARCRMDPASRLARVPG
jgi:hypothetical protein